MQRCTTTSFDLNDPSRSFPSRVHLNQQLWFPSRVHQNQQLWFPSRVRLNQQLWFPSRVHLNQQLRLHFHANCHQRAYLHDKIPQDHIRRKKGETTLNYMGLYNSYYTASKNSIEFTEYIVVHETTYITLR
jgi:hypothetical protein